jgi:hypothetical protein
MPAAPAPIAPVIHEGPVFVIVVPARTAKSPAVRRPGFVAANAVAGQIRTTRAAKINDKSDRRMFFTPPS